MWLAPRTGVFNQQNEKKNKKKPKRNFDKSERVHNERGNSSWRYPNAAKSVKSPKEAVEAVNNMEIVI